MYLNFPGRGEDDDLAGGEAYAHLARVKRAYDPENLLRMNQNVRPA
jgi:FAD/FMN-containing dehydrogenase